MLVKGEQTEPEKWDITKYFNNSKEKVVVLN